MKYSALVDLQAPVFMYAQKPNFSHSLEKLFTCVSAF